jgi:hypothetical protein
MSERDKLAIALAKLRDLPEWLTRENVKVLVDAEIELPPEVRLRFFPEGKDREENAA